MSRRGKRALYATIVAIFLFLFGIFGSDIFGPEPALGYDSNIAHPNIVELAAQVYNAKFNPDLTAEQIGWMKQGAIEEDTPTRWLNHFYDPINDRGLLFNNIRYQSSKKWAQDPFNQQNFSMGDNSWQKAFLYYYKANEKDAFITLGHTLHLIADASVPAHTRDDPHPTGDSYEQFVKTNWDKLVPDIKKLSQFQKVDSLEGAFDSVAKFSNGNFFSADTIESKNYDYPIKGDIKEIETDAGFDAYYKNKNGDNLLVWKSSRSKNWKDNFVLDTKQAPLNNTILTSYSQNLLPKAVGYTAGVIRLFIEQAEDQTVHDKVPLIYINPKGVWDTVVAGLINKAGDIWNKIKGNTAESVSAEAVSELSAAVNSEPILSAPIIEPAPAVVPSVPAPVSSPPTPPIIPIVTSEPDSTPTSPLVLPVQPPLIIPSPVAPAPTPALPLAVAPPPAPVIYHVDEIISSADDTTIATSSTTTTETSTTTTTSSTPADDDSITTTTTTITTTTETTTTTPLESEEEDDGDVTTTTPETPTTTPETATTTPTTTYILIYSSGAGGSITGSSTQVIDEGSSGESVTATPEFGYHFVNWSDNVTSTSRTDINVVADLSVSAVFEVDPPVPVAEIVINEIAWAGTDSGHANNEWFELYNTTDATIAMNWSGSNSWHLRVNGVNLSAQKINNSVIAPHGYYLFERTSDNTIKNVTADFIYVSNSDISDSGAKIELIDSAGNVVDSVDASGGWFVGGGSEFRSMERIDEYGASSVASTWQSNQGPRFTPRTYGGSMVYGSPRDNNIGTIALIGNQLENELTLTAANSPYLLNAYTIPAGKKLIIGPGAVLKSYNNDSSITVLGTLEMTATADNPAIFTSGRDQSFSTDELNKFIGTYSIDSTSQAKDWQGMRFKSGSTGVINNAIIRYAGNNYYPNGYIYTLSVSEAIRVETATVSVTNSTLSNDGTTFIRALDNSALTVQNSIFNTGTTAIKIDSSSTANISDNQYNDIAPGV